MHKIAVHIKRPLALSNERKKELFSNLIDSVCGREKCGRPSVMLSIVGCDYELDRPFLEIKPVLQMSGVNWERGLSYDDRHNMRYLITDCSITARKFRLPKNKCKVHLIEPL